MGLKIRKNRGKPPPEPCVLTECMSIIAGAWGPNVIWHLREGPHRFSELRIDIPPVSAKVLSQRLREFEDRGVVLRSVQPTSPPSVEYSLTPLGRELIPALSAIVEVGHKLKAAGFNPRAATGGDRSQDRRRMRAPAHRRARPQAPPRNLHTVE